MAKGQAGAGQGAIALCNIKHWQHLDRSVVCWWSFSRRIFAPATRFAPDEKLILFIFAHGLRQD